MPLEQRHLLQRRIKTGELELTDNEAAVLATTWEFWARPSQLEPPGKWVYWFVNAGRGYGKTRIGSEWTRRSANSGLFRRVNLIGATADDARDIMIEGESGLLAICPKWEAPMYRPSKRRLDWPNGCYSLIFTADEPERLRGKQHERFWADEIASWKYPEAWDQAVLGLRIGPDPRAVVTSTPRPVRVVRDLLANPNTVVTHGSTYENVENLAPVFLQQIVAKYEGTRMGRQELEAELLEDVEGALWSRKLLDENRAAEAPHLDRLVVGVDPSASSKESANDAGIVGAGYSKNLGYGFVLADRTCHGSPQKWALAAIELYRLLKADCIVAEVNNGGEMVRTIINLLDSSVPVVMVSATRGKRTRAEPVSMLYEQHRVKHVGSFSDLEDQMVTWTPAAPDSESPDRMDALVWALTYLMVKGSGASAVSYRPDQDEPVRRTGDLVLKGARYVDAKPTR